METFRLAALLLYLRLHPWSSSFSFLFFFLLPGTATGACGHTKCLRRGGQSCHGVRSLGFLIESQASGFRRARTQTGNSASSTSGNNFPPRSLPCGNDVNPLPVPSCRSLGCAAASGSGSHSRTGTNDTLEYLFPSDVHDWCVAGRSEGNLNYAV